MKISRQEKIYAAECFALLVAGVILVGGVGLAGVKATSIGGSWWFIFLGAGVGATVAGEIVKKRMENLVKMSREARGTSANRPDKSVGFTLVEIMTVVTVVGILASLALPGVRSLHTKAQNSALMNDLRTFESAFLLYSMEMGQWPEDQNRATLPPEMDGYIPGGSFTRETPIGGHYDWDPSTSGSLPDGIAAAISVRGHKASADQVEALVKSFEGGTGQIRANGADIHFVIQ